TPYAPLQGDRTPAPPARAELRAKPAALAVLTRLSTLLRRKQPLGRKRIVPTARPAGRLLLARGIRPHHPECAHRLTELWHCACQAAAATMPPRRFLQPQLTLSRPARALLSGWDVAVVQWPPTPR